MITKGNGSLNDVFDRKASAAWKTGHADVLRFYCDDGVLWGFPCHGLAALHQNDKGLFLHYHGATVTITGPKLTEFLEDFVVHNAVSIKADGVDIESVTISVGQREEEEE